MTLTNDNSTNVEELTYAESALDVVGNTPLIRLNKVMDGAPPLVLAKVEYLNPAGSIKDRPALAMLNAAEKSGELRPGGTIVEPTSGNTGSGLAMAAGDSRLPLHFGHARQNVERKNRHAARLRCRSRRHADQCAQ